MMMLRANKQNMKYALFVGSTPEYEKDEAGNTVFDRIDGRYIPRQVGNTEEHYDTPVDFSACITSELNELQMKAWGVDQSAIYSQITVQKGYLPIKPGALVWRENEVEWENASHTIPKASSADYTVCGIMTEGLTADCYLLKRQSSEE